MIKNLVNYHAQITILSYYPSVCINFIGKDLYLWNFSQEIVVNDYDDYGYYIDFKAGITLQNGKM